MAADQHSLRLTITAPDRSRDNDDFVRLEQEPWDINTGYITKFAMFRYLNHLLFDADPPEADCPVLGPHTVYAYPSRPDLDYLLGCSWGTLGPRRIDEAAFSEAIQCNLQTELEPEYPPLTINGYTWLGEAYSPAGDVLTRPAVTIVDGKIRIAQAVYGTLLVNYTVCRHLYELSTPVRPGALENTIQSHVYACWDGGNTVLEIERQDGEESGECNYLHDADLDVTPDGLPPDHVDPENEYVDIDYCTGLPVEAE